MLLQDIFCFLILDMYVIWITQYTYSSCMVLFTVFFMVAINIKQAKGLSNLVLQRQRHRAAHIQKNSVCTHIYMEVTASAHCLKDFGCGCHWGHVYTTLLWIPALRSPQITLKGFLMLVLATICLVACKITFFIQACWTVSLVSVPQLSN